MERQIAGGKGILLVVSGPSGAGKGTLSRALAKGSPSLILSISATTRKARPGELEGEHYFFLKKEDFLKMIDDGLLLEWAEVYGNYYGTPIAFVQEAMDRGNDVILEIDINGALQVKEKVPDAVLVFIAPPSIDELERRLVNRKADSAEEIGKRLGCAADEMEKAFLYDYLVVNDEIVPAVERLKSILAAEKMRPKNFNSFILNFGNKMEGNNGPTVSR